MVKTKQETQFKGEMHMNKLQESCWLYSLSLTNTKKTKSKKKSFLEDNYLKIHDKIAVLEKQSDIAYSCMLHHNVKVKSPMILPSKQFVRT